MLYDNHHLDKENLNIVMATTNAGKVKEIQQFFENYPITFIPQNVFEIPDIEETGLSFVENALLKARHASAMSNMPALADDSGLCVAALDNTPGIYSARYAGPNATSQDNIQKLLEAARDIPAAERQAQFYCVIAFVRHARDPLPLICQGSWDGTLLTHPQGTHGFGYDPLFFVPEHQCSAAELPEAVKNTISHRAKALNAFVQQLMLQKA